MSKITVNETVTKSVSFENNLVDVQTALDRCFLLLEERRFKEAHVIIEQILNIDPNNTDAHVANFLYQFKLSDVNKVVKNYQRCITYRKSLFYKRVKRSAQTEMAKTLDFNLEQASEQLKKFNIEQERIRKEEEQRQKILFEESKRRYEEERIRREMEEEYKRDEDKLKNVVGGLVVGLPFTILMVFLTAFSIVNWPEGSGAGFWFGLGRFLFWVAFVVTLAFTGLCLFQVVSNARDIYRAIKKKRQKQLDQQKTDQAAD